MIVELFLSFLLLLTAFMSIHSKHLRHSVLYLSAFSILCALYYLLLHAPDVALAEAVIGCSLSTILYLVALTKYKLFTIYYIQPFSPSSLKTIFPLIRAFCRSEELEDHGIHTHLSFEEVCHLDAFDVAIVQTSNGIVFYGAKDNDYIQKLDRFLARHSAYFESQQLEVSLCLL